MHSSGYDHHFMENRWRDSGNSDRPYFGGFQNHCRWWLQPWNEKTLTPWKKSYDQPRQHIKKQRHYFVNKGPSSQSFGLSKVYVWMWELNYEESWALKNWCFWTVVLDKTLESPLDCKEIQPVHPKGIFIGRTDAEAETIILWPADAKNWLIWKDPVAGKDWRWEEKGMTEDEMVGWHHWLNGHEFEYTPGVGDWQGGLACCGSWGHRVGHDWATKLNWGITIQNFSPYIKSSIWNFQLHISHIVQMLTLNRVLDFSIPRPILVPVNGTTNSAIQARKLPLSPPCPLSLHLIH